MEVGILCLEDTHNTLILGLAVPESNDRGNLIIVIVRQFLLVNNFNMPDLFINMLSKLEQGKYNTCHR